MARSLVQNGTDFSPLVLGDLTLDVVPDFEPPLAHGLLLLFVGYTRFRYNYFKVSSFLLLC